jgi:hypothetical protein
LLTSLAAVGLLTSGVALAHGRASANLIKNGSFEQPVVPNGSYQLFSTGQRFPGWAVVGARGNIASISGTYTSDGLLFPAKTGKQWCDLTGLTNSATGIAQRAKTVPGTRYRLTFSVGNEVNPGGIFGTATSVAVAVNGHRLLLATNTLGADTKRQVWKSFLVTFKATSKTTTISFINRDPPTDNEDGLDAVSLTRAG